jgi:Na+-driven multidrug efflux pump
MASASFMAFPDQILRIFSKDGELIAGAVPLMFIIAITVFPVSVNVVIGNAIRGMKDTKWMFYTQSFGTLFTIILSALMLFVWEMELKGVFLTILFDECIRAALNYRHFMVLNRRKQDQGKQAAAQGSKAWSISGARYFKLWPRP